VAFHDRKPISTSKEHKGKDGSKTVLPKWGSCSYKVAKEYLDRMEFILLGDNVDPQYWTSLLLKSVEDNADARWILDEIVTPKLSWSEARMKFVSHFESTTYKDQLEMKYQSIKQHKLSVQKYGGAFLDLINQLGYSHQDSQVINKYLYGLDNKFHTELKKHFDFVALATGKEVELTDLKEVIVKVENFDRVLNNAHRGFHSLLSNVWKEEDKQECKRQYNWFQRWEQCIDRNS
jgi:hypothetical protein